MRALLYLGLVVVYLLHNDFWLWEADGRFLWLPIGLAYHLSYCLLIVVWMAMMVKWAWPRKGMVKSEPNRPDVPREPMA